jgi:hypothetical protein
MSLNRRGDGLKREQRDHIDQSVYPDLDTPPQELLDDAAKAD